jgi:hypothetical protein
VELRAAWRIRLARERQCSDDGGVDDPGLEQRRRTGRTIILVGGCLGPLALLIPIVLLLAIWQFLAPVERSVPSRPASAPSGAL